ncbi:polyprenyl synthetase family protein [Opitutia bacterium ISCC 51]|nr:polyprenyl synthetase family protein [Opitutae bacterium ISCC 51]QXD27161.1 polyprenyl synthetase family protein [Opitutae bacterium ISCC 52]
MTTLNEARPSVNSGKILTSDQIDVAMLARCRSSLPGNDPLLIAFSHHVRAGGGRTRARLAYQASLLLNLTEEDALELATAVELVHNASLVQDDFQDRSENRRGRSSVWYTYGMDTAVCLTDLLLSSSFASLSTISHTSVVPQLISHLHRAVTQTLRGQLNDVSRDENSTIENYLSIAERKSGPFFALALELPLIVAGHQGNVVDASRAASHFALGYQIIDDIADKETDRYCEAGVNAFLILEQKLGEELALSKTLDLAQEQLEISRSFVAELPNGFLSLIEALIKPLEETIINYRHA